LIERKDIDLTAPVGSFESLQAAIQGGADSIYFGIDKLNMRARSSVNFNKNDLKKIVAVCNDNDINSYLTLNIVFYDNELDQMKEIVSIAKEYGIKAIIASDQAVINYARSVDMEVHLSTQVNISNFESVKYYADYADAIVLARELNLDQVKEIFKRITDENISGPSGNQLKLEMFVHGALCMSISGKCYLSLHEHNHSANRGDCLQDCRRAYIAKEKETNYELEIDNEYIMSPKDLCTIHFLNKLLDAGVRVFKIEGRARPPEYVFTAVSCYNEAINAILEGSYTREKIADWRKRLSGVFNRGFWDGYYLGQRLGEWSDVYGSKANKRKIYVAKGMNYFSKLRVAEFLCEAGKLQVGDEIIITGPTTGVIKTKIHEIRVNFEKVNETVQGERFSIPLEKTIRRSDKLYKWADNNDLPKK
jgi:putative protease